jgi:hypothetical protein
LPTRNDPGDQAGTRGSLLVAGLPARDRKLPANRAIVRLTACCTAWRGSPVVHPRSPGIARAVAPPRSSTSAIFTDYLQLFRFGHEKKPPKLLRLSNSPDNLFACAETNL